MRISAFLLTSLLLSHSLNADLIVPQTAAARILVPAAGNAAGANGTFFRSDIQVVNLRNAEQRVRMFWLPQGSSGAAIAARSVDIGALSGIGSEDFVASVMLQSGVGGIEFVGVTETGQFDQNARLHVTSRIWTPRPDGGSGTMSQTFPALIMPGSTARVKTAFGLRHSSQYRVNVGITNPSDTVHLFRVSAFSVTEVGQENPQFEVTVQPRSIEQRVVNGLIGNGTVQVLIENLTEGTATDWQGWASSIDNQSGDAWSQIAFPASQ
ncbi:MAG: hypothetical protein M3P06_00395 [Acidobacteriota bacterium]|nr:hypothetical protein [Acidobacteriota bacterium]